MHMRKKPLHTMLEEIMIYLIERFYHQGYLYNHHEPNNLEKLIEFGKDMW